MRCRPTTSPRGASPTATSSCPGCISISSHRVLFIFGTRPEAIKLCPLIAALQETGLQSRVCVTAQHREMLDQVLCLFQVKPDYDLDAMTPGQTLTVLTARLLQLLEPIIRDADPSLVVVQGDTTTTMCGALSAFYAGVPVAHVEAGLRTGDLASPFPEEMNRSVTTRLAALHFAPTAKAAANLAAEGVPAERVFVTGNTGIDAVLQIQSQLGPFEAHDKKLILVTAHRRESFGPALENICAAVSEIAGRPDVEVIWPVHPNPQVRKAVANCQGITLVDPLPYIDFVHTMRKAYLILTDSGGVQEEAPSLGKPVLVLREKTEREEAVTAGTVRLVGTDKAAIVRECNRLLDDPAEYQRMSRAHNPYGDGTASRKIANHIVDFLTKSVP